MEAISVEETVAGDIVLQHEQDRPTTNIIVSDVETVDLEESISFEVRDLCLNENTQEQQSHSVLNDDESDAQYFADVEDNFDDYDEDFCSWIYHGRLHAIISSKRCP